MAVFPFDSDALPGPNVVVGAAGTDTVIITIVSAQTTVDISAWTLVGWDPNPTDNDRVNIVGSAGADTITGSIQVDVIDGKAGDDTIVWDGSDETVKGGDDTDTLVVNSAVTIDLGNLLDQTTSDTATVTEFENVDASGSAAAVNLTGDNNANVLTGGADADTISGLGGNDTIDGKGGSDTIDGGLGDDRIVYDGADATVAGGGNDADGDTLVVNGAATINLGAADQSGLLDNADVTGFENVDASGSKDAVSLTGSDVANVLAGGSAADTINAGEGNDEIVGFSGADQVDGGLGTDTLTLKATSIDLNTADDGDLIGIEIVSAAGADAVVGPPTGVTIDLSNQSDGFTIIGSDHNDIITGSTFVDVVKDGADVIDAGEGDDEIVGFSGADQVDGGLGTDTLTLAATSNDLTDASDGDLIGVEIVSAALAGAGLTIDLSNQSEGFTITGSDHNDIITGSTFVDVIKDGADIIDAGEGDDEIVGFSGADQVDGGLGTDTLTLEATSIDLTDASDDDLKDVEIVSAALAGAGLTIDLSKQSDGFTITGSDHNDIITGSTFVDVVNDGADVIDAGLGDDRVVYDGTDVSVEGGGNDVGGDTLEVNAAATVNLGDADQTSDSADVTGFENVDASGSSDAVDLTGDSGANTLTGGSGNDTIDGGGGADTLAGGGGSDQIVYDGADVSIDGGDNGGDTLVVNDAAIVNLGNAADQTSDDTAIVTGFEHVDASGAGANEPVDLTGDANANTLTGGSGDDTIDGKGGSDTLDGGLGDDRIVYDGTDVSVAGGGNNAGGDTLEVNAAAIVDLGNVLDQTTDAAEVTGFENVDASGSAGPVDLTGDDGANTLIGSSVADTIEGAGGADTIDGGAGDDEIIGFVDADEVDGGDDTDTLILAATSADLNDAADGDLINVEIVSAALAAAGVTIDLSNQSDGFTITGSAQGDTIVGSSDEDTIDAGGGNDEITGGNGADVINGQGGQDRIIGFVGADQVDGGGNDDTIVLDGTSADLNDAADGDIVNVEAVSAEDAFQIAAALSGIKIDLSGQSDGFAITGSLLKDTLIGSSGNDAVDGGDGDDKITAGEGADFVQGGAGNDTIIAGAGDGNDVYNGGGGSGDTVDYSKTSGGVKVDLRPKDQSGESVNGDPGNFDALMALGGFADETTEVGLATGAEIGTDVLHKIENVIGSTGNDTILGDDGVNVLDGDDGEDKIWGYDGNDTIRGGNGKDTLVGGKGNASGQNSGNDTLLGGNGKDKLFGEDGKDILRGGEGNDQYAGGSGKDTLYFDGDKDKDKAWGGDNRDTFVFEGKFGTDTIKDFLAVGSQSDKIDLTDFRSVSFGDLKIVQNGNNTEITGLGSGRKIVLEVVNAGSLTADDFIFAPKAIKGNGNDNVLKGGKRDDDISGLGGDDKLKGKDGDDLLKGGKDDDKLYGEGDNDTLKGDNGADKLFGGGGDDILKGGDGKDKLEGGKGNDTLTGGGGKDKFAFDAPNEGVDTITDFDSGKDVLQFSAKGFGNGLKAGETPNFVKLDVVAGYTDAGNKGVFLFDTSGADKGTLFWDANGGSSSDAVAIAMLGNAGLSKGDFDII
ncbi:beta strand repeat-containing protein [Bauldia sp.]|uniref:beta strand repeat-containing protein n=1 Tax=Bauldia sp. TaxID=2575872 RepID=UPI003BAB413A